MPITTTPSGGPQGEFSTYTPIYSQTLSSNTSSITFSNIPTTFTDLVLVCSARSAWTSDEYEAVGFRFNGDSSNNYSTTFVAGNGSSAVSFRESTQPQITARMNPSTSSNTAFSSIIVQIQNYSNVTTNKTVLIRSNSSVEFYEVAANVGTWRSTSPIISLFVGNARANLVAGSTFTLYGIKAAAPAPKATGGDVITTDGTYWYHAFKNSGIFDVKTAMNVDYLVVAGGGGGGFNRGGGGGAGGYRTSIGGTALSLTAQAYSVTVGAGGAGGLINGTNPGTAGANSVFSTITSNGGGSGGGSSSSSGGNGGSGGGGGQFYIGTSTAGTGNTPSTSPSQGNNGGVGASNTINGTGPNTGGAGGGGGAGGAGSTGAQNPNGVGGNGGNGSASSITGSSVTYAGGGGGGGYNSTGGTGGTGGGGNGTGNDTTASSGTANLGGGGGGGGGLATGANGGNGGSGIVIVRYTV
jgi:hypothetical protein